MIMSTEFVNGMENLNDIISIIKMTFISICTYSIALKIWNKKKIKKGSKISIAICIIIATINQIVRVKIGNLYSIICLILLLSIFFSKTTKCSIDYSLVTIAISLSANYIIYFISAAIGFIPAFIFQIKNDYIGIIIILFIYTVLINLLNKIKRFKKGLIFIQNKLKEEYFSMMIFNISIPILFIAIVLPNYQVKFTGNFILGLIIFSILMYITIQKSLQMYYKQRLLIQELDETKKELENKKKEINELEQENLNFSKASHTIAHRQKALEYKLEELLQKSEIAEEIGISEKSIRKIESNINEITKDISDKETIVKLPDTGIDKIDNMLKYMQSECIKNKIDFQVQINGNIHHMTNKYISKEDLEILLADHIKNAIIAINHSDNTHRSIFVRLGLIDEIYSLYIYDSGIEFEKETLENLGKKPSTTHKEEGGTGMGFMNTFDTLNKYKASMIIKEIGKPSKDDYTKVIIMKFDNKHTYEVK